jgi:magnesium transporter
MNLEPFQISEIIEDLPRSEDILLFRLLSRKQAKETFQNLSHEKQEKIIENLARNIRMITTLLNDLDPDDRTAFLEELPGRNNPKIDPAPLA